MTDLLLVWVCDYRKKAIDQYVTDLKIKASSCEFGELRDNLIHDRIICKITCDKMRNMLLREGDITLQRTVKVCRANKTMKLQLKSMSHTTTTDSNTEREIHCIKSKPVTNTAKPNCSRCGYKHTINQTCPAYGAECHGCGRKNHFAKVCRSSYHKRPNSTLLNTTVSQMQKTCSSEWYKRAVVPKIGKQLSYLINRRQHSS